MREALAEVHAFDPVGERWERVASIMAPLTRRLSLTVWTGEEMLIVGGCEDSIDATDGYAFRLSDGKWRPLPRVPSDPE